MGPNTKPINHELIDKLAESAFNDGYQTAAIDEGCRGEYPDGKETLRLKLQLKELLENVHVFPPFTDMSWQSKVNQSCDNALKNGCDILTWTDEEIAIDLSTDDSQFESWSVDRLVPYVKVWREAHTKNE